MLEIRCLLRWVAIFQLCSLCIPERFVRPRQLGHRLARPTRAEVSTQANNVCPSGDVLKNMLQPFMNHYRGILKESRRYKVANLSNAYILNTHVVSVQRPPNATCENHIAYWKTTLGFGGLVCIVLTIRQPVMFDVLSIDTITYDFFGEFALNKSPAKSFKITAVEVNSVGNIDFINTKLSQSEQRSIKFAVYNALIFGLPEYYKSLTRPMVKRILLEDEQGRKF